MEDLAATLAVVQRLRGRYSLLFGEAMMGDPKETLGLLATILDDAGVPYAIIGGMAAQVWRKEPRTTLDVDVAIRTYESLPVDALLGAGFRHLARHPHTDNWVAPDGSPVQFADDPAFADAIATSVRMPLGDRSICVVRPLEFVRTKLLAHADATRRRSKRLQDLADAEAVLEAHPDLRAELTDDQRRLLEG